MPEFEPGSVSLAVKSPCLSRHTQLNGRAKATQEFSGFALSKSALRIPWM